MFSFVLSENKSILSCQLLCLHPRRAEALINAFVWRLSVWHLSVSLSVTFCYNLRSPPSCILALTLLVAVNYVLGHLTWYVRVTISRHNFSYTVDAAIFLSDESQATEPPFTQHCRCSAGSQDIFDLGQTWGYATNSQFPTVIMNHVTVDVVKEFISRQQPMLRWLLSSWPATRGRNNLTVQLAAIENKQETW